MSINWIKQVMDDRGISIEELAEVLDLSERTIRNYYNGSARPGMVIRMNLIKVLDLIEEEVDEMEAGDDG